MTSRTASRTPPEADAGQRLDKWLWFARITKTRTLATRLVESGKTRVNRARVRKAGRTVRPDDVITLVIHGRVRVLKVRACGLRRGPAVEARELYEDISPPRVRREKSARAAPAPIRREKGAGRPTKRERRRMDAWLRRPDGPAGETGKG